jgi:transcriptional regulator with XRE-family HTH domain
MKSFGSIIRGERQNRNLPLRKVAAALDIDPSILSKIERGVRVGNRDLVCKLSDYFELDKDELLTQYFSDVIAQTVYQESNTSEILEAAEMKVEYLKNTKIIQTNIKFSNE